MGFDLAREALEPCPFCGGAASDTGVLRYNKAAARDVGDGKQREYFFCNCIHCGVSNQGLTGYRTTEEAVSAWNRRARSDDAIGSGVKALEWQESAEGEWRADIYRVRCDIADEPPLWVVSGWAVGTNPYSTLNEAKAAAQADYERRVLSCLSPVAVEEADAKAGEPVGFAFEVLWHNDTWCLDFSEMPPVAPAGGEIRNVRPLYAAAPSNPSPQIGNAGAGPVGEAVADEGWQPIETAPTGGKFGCFLMLAFGPQGDQTVSEGMHFQGRFYAASVFYTGGPHDTKQFTFREHEVKPTHWRHTLVAPGAARPVEEPGEVERAAWRAIEERDQIVETIQTFGDVTLRNSHPVWVRDADGRVYEAVWTVDDRGRAYWWDTEGESPADPADILPHPLTERAALTGDAQEAGR